MRGEYVDLTGPGPSEPQTPTTSQAPSESDSTHPTTPSSTAPIQSATRSRDQAQTPKQPVPLVPVVPILPEGPNTPKQQVATGQAPQDTKISQTTGDGESKGDVEESTAVDQPTNASPAAPKSWADLVRSKNARDTNIVPTAAVESGDLQAHRNESLSDVLTGLGSNVDQYGEKIAFLEPRGLVNTGNMCYMNSVSLTLGYTQRLVN